MTDSQLLHRLPAISRALEAFSILILSIAPTNGIVLGANAYLEDFSTLPIGVEWVNSKFDIMNATGNQFLGLYGGNGEVVLINYPVSGGYGGVTQGNHLSFTLYVIGSWDGYSSGPDQWMLSNFFTTDFLINTNFSSSPNKLQAYPDSHDAGRHPGGTGAIDMFETSFAIRQDVGIQNVHEYRLSFNENPRTGRAYRFKGVGLETFLGNPVLSSESWGIDNVLIFDRVDSIWDDDQGDGWSNTGRWHNSYAPQTIGDTAIFGDAITQPRTVNNDGDRTISRLIFDSDHAYTISGIGAIGFDEADRQALIASYRGNHTVERPLIFHTETIVDVSNQDSMTLSGPLTAASDGKLIKRGGGSLVMSGTAASILVNHPTVVEAGELHLAKEPGDASNNFGSALGELIIQPGATVSYAKNWQIREFSPVTVNSGGTLALRDWSEFIGGLRLNNGRVTGNPTKEGLTINPTGPNNPSGDIRISGNSEIAARLRLRGEIAFDIADGSELVVGGPISEVFGAGRLRKTGNGKLILAGSNSYSGGTAIEGGIVLANNASGSATGLGDLTIGSGGTLAGTGFLAGTVTVELGGTVSPGESVGTLTVGNIILNPNSSLAVELGGVGHDQLAITGTASLGGMLDVSLLDGFSPSLSDSFEIITATEGVDGAFATLANDLPALGAGLDWKINYGSNNVVLAVVSALLAGDYNDDGTVNAADYTLWLNNLGAPAGTLSNDVDGGIIGAAQYATWKANFGNTSPPSSLATATVPEPSALLMLIVLLGLPAGGFLGARGCSNRAT